jgi:glucose-1-phosphate thymidylyltransferase
MNHRERREKDNAASRRANPRPQDASEAPAGAGFRKAILYAGGGLAELYPLTSVLPKGLLPVYDKPLVYYALSVLMLAGIRRIALVSRVDDRDAYERLLGDGSAIGIELAYLTQADPAGPAQALVTAQKFVAREPAAMILADCLIYGDGLQRVLAQSMQARSGATVFAHPVGSPQQHAVIQLDDGGDALAIEDKPARPRSNLAVMGITFYDREAVDVARGLDAARQGAYTLSDVHRAYLAQGRLHVRSFGRGFAWLDTSTPAALNAATNFIEAIESTHGLKIGCPEEIAYQRGFITAEQLARAAAATNNAYGEYLQKIAASGRG